MLITINRVIDILTLHCNISGHISGYLVIQKGHFLEFYSYGLALP